MKIAISTESGSVSAHFGRCPSYTLVEIEDERIISKTEIANPGHQPGFLPPYLAEKGVEVIIAGGMGPRAQGLFARQNIQTVLGVQGQVDEVIQKFIDGNLEPGLDLCDHQYGGHDLCRNHSSEQPVTPLQGSKICVTATGPGLDSDVDPRFGRAAYLLIIDPDTMSVEPLQNPNRDLPHGAGIQTAQLVAEKKVKVVLTGEVGPNAHKVLQSSGISILTGRSGPVDEAVKGLGSG